MRAAAAAAVFSLLGIIAAWTRDDPCPTVIRATIPNHETRHARVSPFHYYDGGEDFFSYGAEGSPGEYEPLRGSGYATVAEVHECLVACHETVTALDLRVALMGCSQWPDRFNLPFDLAGSEKFPDLEELSLEGYAFNQREWEDVVPKGEFRLPGDDGDGDDPEETELSEEKRRSKRYQEDEAWLTNWGWWFWTGKARRFIEWRRLPEEQRLKTNIELWLEAMDFSKLRALTLADYSTGATHGDVLLRRLPKALKGLQSLDITGTWQSRDGGEDGALPARDFILNIAPEASLTSLSWVDLFSCDKELFEAVLQRHGPSLTSLEWRSSERGGVRPVFSTAQIQRLSSLAPKLGSLTIDMHREGNAWPKRDLEALATSLPRLTNLTIYWELQSECRLAEHQDPFTIGSCDDACRGTDQLASPRLDLSSGEALFRLLRSAKVGDELTAVMFRAGDFTRPNDGPVYIPEWIERRTVWVECSVLRDDGTRKRGDEALCRGEDHSMNPSDQQWMRRCGSDRTCKPKKSVLEPRKERRLDADVCWHYSPDDYHL